MYMCIYIYGIWGSDRNTVYLGVVTYTFMLSGSQTYRVKWVSNVQKYGCLTYRIIVFESQMYI